jgi:flavin reductase (DIM6/NTAB) family NADH-FMN oxidoreductase RutF
MGAPEFLDDGVAAQFRAAMRKFPATVTVVTANDGVRDHGMTVTAVRADIQPAPNGRD